MIKSSALLFTAFLSFDVSAGDCEKYHELAKSVMMHRQAGTGIIALLKAVGPGAIATAELARKAYSRPMMSHKDNKKLSINEFANEVYLECLSRAEEENAL